MPREAYKKIGGRDWVTLEKIPGENRYRLGELTAGQILVLLHALEELPTTGQTPMRAELCDRLKQYEEDGHFENPFGG